MDHSEHDVHTHVSHLATPPRFSFMSPLSLPGAPLADALYAEAMYIGPSLTVYPNAIPDSLRAIRKEQESERCEELREAEQMDAQD